MRMLFAVNETGSAAYFAPLLKRYLEAGHGEDCRYIAGPAAERYLKRNGIAGVPILAPPACETGMQELLRGWSPDVIATSATGADLERFAIRMGRSASIPTVSIIDIWMNYRWRFEWPDGLVLPDLILVPDEQGKSEAIGDGLPVELIEVVGQPAWELAEPLSLPAERRTLFVGQPAAPAGNHNLGYTVHEAWDLVRNTAERFPEYFGDIIYGVHPDQPPPDAATLAGARISNNAVKVLPEVETVLGMSSSLLIDALLAGRRVISVQPGAKGMNIDPLSRHGKIPRAKTSEELLTALKAQPIGGGNLNMSFIGSLDRLDMVLQNLCFGND
jgi:hypothetical protein